jgi:TetR/AcrR family transcriptional repressor of mexJK operon
MKQSRHHGSKHEAVFRAAKAVFVQQGYDGASMDEVAALAGATKATVYSHAGSKAELFRLVVREAVHLSAEKIEPPDRELALDAALERFLARFIEISCWEGSVGLQRTVMSTLDRFPEHGGLIDGNVVGRAVSLLAAFLEERGLESPREAAAALIGAATGQRRFATLLGVQPALPFPPLNGQIQDGAMDEAIRYAVAQVVSSVPRLS